jgi:tRNA modification GTPase
MSEPTGTTWVTCLTPPGQGALATLGVVGPDAWRAVTKCFRQRSGRFAPATPTPGCFWLGRMGGETGAEVVLALKKGTHLVLEIHCHGGIQVVRFLTDLLRAEGVQVCTWPEFLRITTEDPLTTLAAVALADAPTTRTAAILLDQHAGALGHALSAIVAALDAGDADAAHRQLDELLRHAPLGLHLCRPWRVVVAGAPNVGKSSLVNALAGYQRSIVAPTPGTTRDVVTVRLAIDGWPIEVADTAGLRDSGATLEEEGIRQARAAAAEADLCLWVLDASSKPVWPGAEVGAVQFVVNKIDLPPTWDLVQAAGAIRVSAANGTGLAELCSTLAAQLVPTPPPPGAAVPFTASLIDEISKARDCLAAGNLGQTRSLLAGLLHPA